MEYPDAQATLEMVAAHPALLLRALETKLKVSEPELEVIVPGDIVPEY